MVTRAGRVGGAGGRCAARVVSYARPMRRVAPSAVAGRSRSRAQTVLLAALVGLVAIQGCARPVPQPDLLLLITADTLRADRLGAYGSTRALTPHLDALAADGVVFTRAYAPASFTVPSVAALMTGRYPEALGIWSNESGLPDDAPTLATELRARAWRTAAVVSNYVLRRASGVDRGFEHYDDRYPQREASRRRPERVAQATTADALTALDTCASEGMPCFLWVHYQDPHGPYTPPESLRAHYLERERGVEGGTTLLAVRADERGMGGLPRYQVVDDQREVAFYRSGYDAEVRYLDENVGQLLAGVRARGLGERAVIVFAADHGEALGEGDYWFAHGEYLTDPLVRVPLVVVAPGRHPARRDDLVSLVDVFPTLLRMLVDAPAGAGLGRDLFATAESEEARVAYLANLGAAKVPRHGIVEGDYKYVVEEARDERAGRLYRLGDESTDVGARFPEVRDRLADRLSALRLRMQDGRPRLRRTLSDIDRAHFRALGYLEGNNDAVLPGGERGDVD